MRLIEESAWWWAAVHSDGMPIHESTPPQPGYYKRRLVARGQFVPARIWIERDADEETNEIMSDDKYHCEVNGNPADAFEEWLHLCKHAISQEEYELMMETVYV